MEDDSIRCRWKSPKNTLLTLPDMETEAIVGYYKSGSEQTVAPAVGRDEF